MKNDILDMLKKYKVGWTAVNAPSLGTQFINTVAECLWLLDGNHHTLESRGYAIPKIFQVFSDYNKPETHKHKRRHAESLSVSLLTEQSVSLLNLTEMSFMKSNPSKTEFSRNLKNFASFSSCKKRGYGAPLYIRTWAKNFFFHRFRCF